MVSASAERLTEKPAVLPPNVTDDVPEGAAHIPEAANDDAQSIAGFICTIEYADAEGAVTERFISCRRYELVNDVARVGAICGKSGRYRTFIADRIREVCDAQTGESLGNGGFFAQFAPDAIRERVDHWNTTPDNKALIVAGLNVLCFMARCDGEWHPLEEEVIEDFVCSLWLRSEWEGEPPLDRIAIHARRLGPDGEVFRDAIRQYGQSATSATLLSRFVQRVISADGVICDHEHRWSTEFAELLAEASA